MIVKHSEVPVDPEHRAEALELITELARNSRAESGVIEYRVTVDIEDRNTFRILEEYEDETAAQKHESSDHLAQFVDEFEHCLAAESELRVFDVDSVETTDGP